MDVFTVSFFGHREVERATEIEERLEKLLHDLIIQKEYVELLIGRDGDFDLIASSLIKRAIKDTTFEALAEELEGPTALAVSAEDSTAPARVLFGFVKDMPALELKCGVVEGTYYGRDTIEKVATIPPRAELLGRLLGSMQSPIANFARVIKQIAEKDEPAA